MLFSSIFFLIVFLPLTLILYYIVPKKLKNLMLLLCSLVFYAWGEPVYVFLMMFSIVFNYICGIEIDSYRCKQNKKRLKGCLIFNVAVNFGLLGFFKYYGFFVGNLNAILPFDIPIKELALPIGISFYTFQTLSYVIDVYKGAVPVQKNIINFGAYVTMFPQLIAGPIVRYSDIDAQLTERSMSLYKFGEGVVWFIRGLVKKVLLANNIGMCYDAIFALEVSERSVVSAWIGMIAFALQLYFDFSGYSDMAVGLGKMLGFEFVRNFEHPYMAKSASEFWRRWHISLGTWFREYVYIPLGGNRVSVPKQIRNILLVWMLTGFWHGAAWSFILWGLYFGLVLMLEKFLIGKWLKKLPAVLQCVYCNLIVLFSWVIFTAPSLGEMGSYFANMLGTTSAGFIDSTAIYYLTTNLVLLIICCLCASPIVSILMEKLSLWKNGVASIATTVVYGAAFLVTIAYLVNATYNPFLYFRF